MHCPYCFMPLEAKDVEADSVFHCPSCRKQLRARRPAASQFLRFLGVAEGIGVFYAGHLLKMRWVENIGGLLAGVGGLAHLLTRKSGLIVEPADQSIDIEKRRPIM